MPARLLSQNKVMVEQTPDTVLRVPNDVKLVRDGQAIEWTDGPGCFHPKPYAPECLRQFLTLAEGNPAGRTGKKLDTLCDRVLAFAREWGPVVKPDEERVSSTGGTVYTREISRVQGTALTIESLKLLEEAAEEEQTRQERARNKLEGELRKQPVIYTEPLAAWSHLATGMSAMIGLVDYLQIPSAQRKASHLAEAHRQWSLLMGRQSPPILFPLHDAEEREALIKETVSQIASSYLSSAEPAPYVKWNDDFPRVRLWTPNKRASSLYAALVLHFVAVISNPKGTFVCAVCKRPAFKLEGENRPKPGAICADPECARLKNCAKMQRTRDNQKRQALVRPAAP